MVDMGRTSNFTKFARQMVEEGLTEAQGVGRMRTFKAGCLNDDADVILLRDFQTLMTILGTNLDEIREIMTDWDELAALSCVKE